MEKQKIDFYFTVNHKYFAPEQLSFLREKMTSASDERYLLLTSLELRDPSVMQIVSLLLGAMGLDRFMLGETGMGVLKFLTGGCCGILMIMDWFSVQKRAKEYNFKKVMGILL